MNKNSRFYPLICIKYAIILLIKLGNILTLFHGISVDIFTVTLTNGVSLGSSNPQRCDIVTDFSFIKTDDERKKKSLAVNNKVYVGR